MTKVVFVKENWILLGDHYITSIMLVKIHKVTVAALGKVHHLLKAA